MNCVLIPCIILHAYSTSILKINENHFLWITIFEEISPSRLWAYCYTGEVINPVRWVFLRHPFHRWGHWSLEKSRTSAGPWGRSLGSPESWGQSLPRSHFFLSTRHLLVLLKVLKENKHKLDLSSCWAIHSAQWSWMEKRQLPTQSGLVTNNDIFIFSRNTDEMRTEQENWQERTCILLPSGGRGSGGKGREEYK